MPIKIEELGIDPNGWRINCCSFQQDPIVSFGSYQYATFYVPKDISNPSGSRLTSIARRKLPSGSWSVLSFEDYVQTKDDGHNIISMGISGDGIIHLAWDMHGDTIHYRQSKLGLANLEDDAVWDISSFGGVENNLKGVGDEYTFSEVTYPRFLTLPSGDMLLEFRVGRSGLGDDYIYRYSSETQTWAPWVTPYIQGVANNAYIHGFDYGSDNKLHVSWTYRDYVDDRHDASSGETSQEGPNGPENNHDLHYMYSPDEGLTWFNSDDQELSLPVNVKSPTLVMEIPKYSGIMNQEGQCHDGNGGFHVLGRESGYYYHYYRNPISREWMKRKINMLEAKEFGARGKIVSKEHDLSSVYALLPLEDHKFLIMRSKLQNAETLTFANRDDDWEVLESIDGLDGEPVYDRYYKGKAISFLQRVGSPAENESNIFYNKQGLRKIIQIDIEV